MSRIGAEADQDLIEEFLLNIPKKYAEDPEFRITLGALTPDQQVDVLIALQRLVVNKKEIDPVDIGLIFDGPLSLFLKIIISDPMERVQFWQEFKKTSSKYVVYTRPNN